MPIVSTRYVTEGTPETRRVITFYALDHLGVEHPFGPVFSSDANYDPETTKNLIGAKIEARLQEREIHEWLDEDRPVITQHATKADVLREFRRRFRDATGLEAARLAKKLKVLYVAGDITNAQIRTAFGFDAAQLTAFLTRVDAKAAAYDTIIAQAGE